MSLPIKDLTFKFFVAINMTGSINSPVTRHQCDSHQEWQPWRLSWDFGFYPRPAHEGLWSWNKLANEWRFTLYGLLRFAMAEKSKGRCVRRKHTLLSAMKNFQTDHLCAKFSLHCFDFFSFQFADVRCWIKTIWNFQILLSIAPRVKRRQMRWRWKTVLSQNVSTSWWMCWYWWCLQYVLPTINTPSVGTWLPQCLSQYRRRPTITWPQLIHKMHWAFPDRVVVSCL